MRSRLRLLKSEIQQACYFYFFFTGLPMAIPVGKWVGFVCLLFFLFFSFFFRVGKSLACHSPGKWCLCA